MCLNTARKIHLTNFFIFLKYIDWAEIIFLKYIEWPENLKANMRRPFKFLVTTICPYAWNTLTQKRLQLYLYAYATISKCI